MKYVEVVGTGLPQKYDIQTGVMTLPAVFPLPVGAGHPHAVLWLDDEPPPKRLREEMLMRLTYNKGTLLCVHQ